MLVAITEYESYNSSLLEQIFEELSKSHDGSDIYVLIVPSISSSTLTVSSLLDQLQNIYDTSFNMKKQGKLKQKITMLLYNENYDASLASKLWSAMSYTPTVELDKVPTPYKFHIDTFTTIEITETGLGMEKHCSYRLHNSDALFNSIPVVAVGGTFDHLHDGHKILLSISAFLTQETLIIGITGPELLKNKKYGHYMESFETRSNKVTEFVKTIRSNLIPKIYEINDVCGPTAEVEDINALVVSMETMKGSEFINNVRKEKGWKPLDVYSIGVLGSADSETFKDKLSSTDYRRMEYLREHTDDQ